MEVTQNELIRYFFLQINMVETTLIVGIKKRFSLRERICVLSLKLTQTDQKIGETDKFTRNSHFFLFFQHGNPAKTFENAIIRDI